MNSYQAIEAYAEAHSQDEPLLLQELSAETYKRIYNAKMISGHYQGRLLSLISKLIQPKSILEIGTFTGYSALCMAEGMSAEGLLHTIDNNEELADLQEEFFQKSPWANQIKTYLGDAKEIIPAMDLKFDMVFIDADKKYYTEYVEMILPKLNPGAVILSDNVLWKGRVVATEKSRRDKHAERLDAFNKFMQSHPQLETFFLPIRDGISISRFRAKP